MNRLSKWRRFLREQAAIGRNQKEPARRTVPVEGTSGFTVDELSPDAFAAAQGDWVLARWTACADDLPEGEEPAEVFRRDAAEYDWRFTLAGELIENDDEEGTEG